MKKTIYLHIGAPKTGTSSIQAYLLENTAALNEQGIFVPPGHFGTVWPGHHELPISLIKRYSSIWYVGWHDIHLDSETVWESAIQHIRASGCDKAILSSELFSDILHVKCPEATLEIGQQIRYHLSDFDIRVIAYVRPVSEHMDSIYREAVKSSPEVQSFSRFCKYARDSCLPHLHPSLYLDFYAQLFGKDALITKRYDRRTLLNGNVVADFLATVGFQSGEGDHAASFPEFNPSIPAEDIALKRAFNIAGNGDPSINFDVQKMLLDIGTMSREKPLPQDFWDSLSQEVADEQRLLKERYGLDLGDEPRLDDIGISAANPADAFQVALSAWSIKRMVQLERRVDDRMVQLERRVDDLMRTQINAVIRPYLDRTVRVIVQPTGAHAEWLMKHTMLSCANIVAWADRDPARHGQTFFDIPVIPPAEIATHEPDVVFIASPDYGPEIWRSLSVILPDRTGIVTLC